MSTADKLLTIAENVPKVYNAGYEKGKAEGGNDGYIIKGYCTPEEDTKVLSISDLPFYPEGMVIGCAEAYSNGISSSVSLFTHLRNICGAIVIGKTGLLSLGGTSSSRVTYYENGIEFNLISSSSPINGAWFKAGYTYRYIVIGGVAE